MTQETKCPVCKLRFLQALWCPLAAEKLCPITRHANPTKEQRQQLKMDEKVLA